MSQENVSVVEDAYRALTGSGLEAFADHWADDIEWRAMRGRWRGRNAGLAYMRSRPRFGMVCRAKARAFT